MTALLSGFLSEDSDIQDLQDVLLLPREAMPRKCHVYWHLCQRTLIKFPTTATERATTTEEFYNISNFPFVVGALDCTHIAIQSPGGRLAELYRNRKGYFSLNVQVVVFLGLQITNIVARWPGSVHDSTIFNNSLLQGEFERGTYGQSLLLGDGGYACRPYLMTPLRAARTTSERRYNASHIRTRNTVERMFGVWKRRFPALTYGLRIKLSTALEAIVAMAVLQTLSLQLVILCQVQIVMIHVLFILKWNLSRDWTLRPEAERDNSSPKAFFRVVRTKRL
ncbi:putative nuclease HARBI1 [Ornithodoros turicata]|uniref:putative nuclease HARBI1 n=1 Tax=Ornithodoros turicata TaxID=34597 RepID=UPI00313938D2